MNGSGVSEVLEVGVGRHQVVGAQHISATFRLPDHFQGHEFTGGCGTKNAKGLAQIFSGVSSGELGRCRGGHQQGHNDEFVGGISVSSAAARVRRPLPADVAGGLHGIGQARRG